MEECRRSVFSSEVASLFGLTNKGLSFYEDKGLFSPSRSKGGNYRMYEPRHVSLLYRCRLMRQMGMSVDQAVRMAREGRPEDYARMLEEARAAAWQRMCHLEYEVKEIDRRAALVERVERRDFSFEEAERPELCWVEVWDTAQDFPTTVSQARCFQNWSGNSVMTALSIRIPLEWLTPESKAQRCISGFMAQGEEAKFLELDMEPTMIRFPPRRCLYGIFRQREGNHFSTAALRPALEALSAEGYELRGDILTRHILTAAEGDEMARYDEIWLPVE